METPMQLAIKHLKSFGLEASATILEDKFLEKEKAVIIEARLSKDISIAQNVLGWSKIKIALKFENFIKDAEQYYKEKFNQ